MIVEEEEEVAIVITAPRTMAPAMVIIKRLTREGDDADGIMFDASDDDDDVVGGGGRQQSSYRPEMVRR